MNLSGENDQRGRLSLLVADDDPVVRETLSMGLERDFYILPWVGDAAQTVEMAAAHCPDVAVVDVDMPRGGGRHAVRGIVEVSPHTAIVIFSADENDMIVRELLQAGATTYCRKGIGMMELADVIERAVHAVRLQHAVADSTTAS